MTETASLVRVGNGNQKLGSIATFSLPSETTCPGASPWCATQCYAKRIEHRWLNCLDRYALNFLASLHPARFIESMLSQIPLNLPAFRIHVGGDFYSAFYVKAWIAICRRRPSTRFWAYTRSWVDPRICDALHGLNALPHVQIFASTDSTMDLPSGDWRIAFVDSDSRAKGLVCPEQQNKAASCMACGYCFRRARGHVVFREH